MSEAPMQQQSTSTHTPEPETGSAYSTMQKVGLILGPLLFVLIYFFVKPQGMDPKAISVMAATAWIATWWITEAAPIPVTSLLPIVMFPLLNVAAIGSVTQQYGDPTVYLFLGGFLIAVAIERWNLHRRIALGIIALIGASPSRIVLGFMTATGLLSAFLSNTATAMMMLPIGLAVITQVVALVKGNVVDMKSHTDVKHVPKTNFGAALMLGIAYAASIGGVATLIGTPPNAVFAGVASKTLKINVGFAEWMLIGVPVAVVFLLITWWVLMKVLPPEVKHIPGAKELIRAELGKLGPVSAEEWRVLAVFAAVSLLWIFSPFVLKQRIPNIHDAIIAVGGGVALFLIPSKNKKGQFLLDPASISRIPWGILLLFGAGFAVASVFQSSGLAKWMADQLIGLKAVGLLGIIVAVTSMMIFLTEVTSNTAIATLFMPIMASLGAALGVSPLGLMATAALAASFAFMLPVATPPNAIVFSTGYLTIPQMARVGLWLNLIGIVFLSAICYFWLPVAWGL